VLVRRFLPSPRWRPPLLPSLLVALLGVALGLGAYTLNYARGASYLQNDPSACANCHLMRAQYDGWVKSPHQAVAVCNDCHTPHNLVSKYLVKAQNGFRHSYAFTTGDFEEPITIRKVSLDIAEENCRRCHGDMVEPIDVDHGAGDGILCTRCHAGVGH
jgi:cytochrome c nitrite reductase small subunit